ncbi:MAG: aminopeptidase P N-terminal domain-containing protein [Ignavibacteriales bacterium]|nr:aminopeptidase P N-terminal domain-containing protein [Ignavibacteriales bacterium]
MRLLLKTLVPATLVFISVTSQDLSYVEYDKDLLPPLFHKSRRDSLMARMGNDAVAVIYSNWERVRNGDVEYQFRQDDNFSYLTGFPEPDALLLLAPKGLSVANPDDTSKTISVTEVLFVRSKDPFREQWDGRRYGPEGVMKLKGLQYAATNDKFRQLFQSALFASGARVIYTPPLPEDLPQGMAELLRPIRSMIEASKARHSQIELRDPSPMIYAMRVVKTPEEIALLTKATHISALAHNQAMMSCQPGMFEYELQAVYEYVYKRMGAEYAGYPCIVGAAENSIVLHYNTNRRQIKDGDIVLADCAAEYHNYSSDVTRTYPANGRFSDAQRKIYQIVLDAQKASIAMIKPGVSWRDVGAKADQVIEDGLFKLGLIKEKNVRAHRKFFIHGLGHPVGLNVHDVGAPVLQPGMVYTVEPGIYIPEGAEGVEPAYYNIGVRIEDVILVTEDGNKHLSADSPREMNEIEAFMGKKGIGNQPVR